MHAEHPRPGARDLRGTDLELRFGAHVVVDGVSIALASGEVTALVGPNGSGKSTLLRALARLHPISGGTAVLDDSASRDAAGRRGQPGTERSILSLTPREFATRVTMFTQTRSAPQGLSVREVVGFGRHPYRRRFAGLGDADRRAIERALAATGLEHMAERAAGELSGGELQRVWLAACIAQETGVVLLDEPTNHLDLRYQVETLDLIRDLADEHRVAVGVVLHDLDHAARIADHLLLMRSGRILASGPPRVVLTAANIEAAYDIPVEVGVDERSGRLRIDPLGRHAAGIH